MKQANNTIKTLKRNKHLMIPFSQESLFEITWKQFIQPEFEKLGLPIKICLSRHLEKLNGTSLFEFEYHKICEFLRQEMYNPKNNVIMSVSLKRDFSEIRFGRRLWHLKTQTNPSQYMIIKIPFDKNDPYCFRIT